MSLINFKRRSKANLLEIVRHAGIVSVADAKKMNLPVLREYLEAAMAEHSQVLEEAVRQVDLEAGVVETAPKKRGRPRKDAAKANDETAAKATKESDSADEQAKKKPARRSAVKKDKAVSEAEESEVKDGSEADSSATKATSKKTSRSTAGRSKVSKKMTDAPAEVATSAKDDEAQDETKAGQKSAPKEAQEISTQVTKERTNEPSDAPVAEKAEAKSAKNDQTEVDSDLDDESAQKLSYTEAAAEETAVRVAQPAPVAFTNGIKVSKVKPGASRGERLDHAERPVRAERAERSTSSDRSEKTEHPSPPDYKSPFADHGRNRIHEHENGNGTSRNETETGRAVRVGRSNDQKRFYGMGDGDDQARGGKEQGGKFRPVKRPFPSEDAKKGEPETGETGQQGKAVKMGTTTQRFERGQGIFEGPSLSINAIDTQSGSETEPEKQAIPDRDEDISGVLELMPDGYGFLRCENYIQSNRDIYVPPQFIRRFNLRQGDHITGPVRTRRENDRYQALSYVRTVNDLPPDKMLKRPHFERLTPIYPNERFVLETVKNEYSTRIIDLIAPIGKGQRGMIVSPPKAGKTILLKKIANAITINDPQSRLIVLLIDERPEEVTDMQRSIKGEVVYSTFDKTPENHVRICELVLERAMRLVELGEDVVILLDSITRLARAYNLTINPTGRTLSGGLDPGALYGPKRFFGAARNIENGGSLTIVATSLIDTGSRMDEVIFEEFKGTGNMEVYLDRKLSEKRIFPAIDIVRSGTRREDLLMSRDELDAVWSIRKAFGNMDPGTVTESIISLLTKTNNNSHFVSSINVSLNDRSLSETMNPQKQLGTSSLHSHNNGAFNKSQNGGYR